jgi:hypothetical protein
VNGEVGQRRLLRRLGKEDELELRGRRQVAVVVVQAVGQSGRDRRDAVRVEHGEFSLVRFGVLLLRPSAEPDNGSEDELANLWRSPRWRCCLQME